MYPIYPDEIIQIIPAPADMWAWYKNDPSGFPFSNRIVCIALVKDFKGKRKVVPMGIGALCAEAYLMDENAAEFIGYSFNSQAEDYPQPYLDGLDER